MPATVKRRAMVAVAVWTVLFLALCSGGCEKLESDSAQADRQVVSHLNKAGELSGSDRLAPLIAAAGVTDASQAMRAQASALLALHADIDRLWSLWCGA